MTVQLRGELVRSCGPGDIVIISGVFLPTPFTGYRARTTLLSDTYIDAMRVIKLKKSYSSYKLTPELSEKVKEVAMETDVYGRLARSIAPEIYGHEDIKKALLLLMVGGINRHMVDGMRIRGDINICLMGDPGVAKSQMLKHIATIAPRFPIPLYYPPPYTDRGIYTSGKGSSGVGLTAAVIRDQFTGDMVLGNITPCTAC
jgi:DNA replication licensing factor MCM7